MYQRELAICESKKECFDYIKKYFGHVVITYEEKETDNFGNTIISRTYGVASDVNGTEFGSASFDIFGFDDFNQWACMLIWN